jgi:hypothetical protein
MKQKLIQKKLAKTKCGVKFLQHMNNIGIAAKIKKDIPELQYSLKFSLF